MERDARVIIDRPVYTSQQVRDERGETGTQQDGHGNGLLASLRKKCSSDACSPIALARDHLPIVDWLGNYKVKKDLSADIIAGFTIAIMHIPQGMAYATLAELDPIHGIYTAIFPVILYILFGPSKHVSIGTNPLTSILVGSVVARYALLPGGDPISNEGRFSKTDLMTALALLVGLWQTVFAFLRLGKLSWILSEVLVSGYTTAAAIHVLASQLKSILGITLDSHSGPLKLINIAIELFHKISAINWACFLISLACIAILVLNNEIFKPELAKHCSFPMPIQLVVVVIGTLLSYQFNFEDRYDVSVVGELPTGFPDVSVPNVTVFPKIVAESLIIAVVGYSITLSMAKIFAAKFGYRVDGNQEMFGEGVSNIFGSFFASMPAAASMSRSAVQVSVGGRTQLTTAVSASCLSAVIIFAGPLFAALPKAVLSSIIVVALKGMLLQYYDFDKFWKKSKLDGLLWLGTFIAVLLLDVDSGLVVGIGLNVVLLVYRSLRVRMIQMVEVSDTGLFVEDQSKVVSEGSVAILRLGGAITFANFETAMEDLNEKTESNMVTILDLSGVPYVDQSGAKVLKSWMEKCGDKITDKDRSRLLAAPTAKVERMLVRFEISRDALFPSLLDAVRYCKGRKMSNIAGRINHAYSRTEDEAEGGGKDNTSSDNSGHVDESSDEEGQDSGISGSGSPNHLSNTIKSTHL